MRDLETLATMALGENRQTGSGKLAKAKQQAASAKAIAHLSPEAAGALLNLLLQVFSAVLWPTKTH